MGSFVYVVKDDSTVTVRKIVTGAADATRTVVSEGLAVGDKVVIDGADRLREGSKVKLAAAKADVGQAGRGPGSRRAMEGLRVRRRLGPASTPPPTGRRRRRDRRAGGLGAPRRPQRRRRAQNHERAREVDFRGTAPVNPSRLFIERPVATTLLMFAILMLGVVAYKFLPLSALPEVDYPTIQVQTFYPGASPEVMTSSVTAPLERQFGQMPSLSQMMSQSSAGSSVITLRFGLDIGIDIAEQEVQAAINAARQSAALGPAGAADLRQSQSRRRADPDARRDFEDAETHRRRGRGRGAAGSEIVAIGRRRPRLDLRRAAALRCASTPIRWRWPPTRSISTI